MVSMPQLDVATFPSQIFWFVVTFSVLYFFVHFFLLPKIKKCFSVRQSLIDSISDKVAEYEDQIQLQKLKYENGIANAKMVARDLMKDLEIWMEKYRAEQEVLVHKKIKLMFEENDKKINTFREDVKEDFERLVFKITMMYTLSLMGENFVEGEKLSVGLQSSIRDCMKDIY